MTTTRASARLAREPLLVIDRAARAGYPREACGVLLGTRGVDASVVSFATVARNLEAEHAHDHYELDPADLYKAEELARAAGLEVLGVWHTHPDHPAVPSDLDRERAWPGWSYLIVPVDSGIPGGVRSWTLVEGRFVEEDVLA
ncbi:MAG: M67 family metallopeptidase [bacterium]|nr:M67 family metallopeptidase [bacterium]